MCVQSCSGSGWDQGLVLKFFVVSFFEQEVDIGQFADACASVAVLDIGPSLQTHISYLVHNPVGSLHLYLIPTFTFGSSTSVLYLSEKVCCSNGIEQEAEPLPEWLLCPVCNSSARPSGRAHHTTGKATNTKLHAHFCARNEVIMLWRSITTCTALIQLPWPPLDACEILCQMCLDRCYYSPTTGVQRVCTSFHRHT